ncbi:trafficking protein particle complex subunit 11 [Lepeophtheirus salmonis]|uniref:trafficking protein particle complex subunit 11 n=1 Tax=Lepeophtheirus salmonis TaxID=72036 RepID=UPI001AE1F1C3|nr:trafficking protein particle complex subunit 11-like [Lepeophtheirus salmonis]
MLMNGEAQFPEALTAKPSALIGFLGLSLEQHIIWNTFSEVSSRLRFVNMENLEFPALKPKRTTYDWYIPKGILKRNWMSKHLNGIPSVVVLFVQLDWKHPNWSEKILEVASKVKSVRGTLSGRGTKLAVVLIQKEAPLPSAASDEDSERASSLCSACELSSRSLFALPISTDSLRGYAVKLENAFYELSQNYYHSEIRGVKSHRDYLNKTTHLYLFVRHQFKIGFLYELKQEPMSAHKHYGHAYSLLMEVRATDTNIMEVKTVAGFINYKVCRLAFALNLNRDAIAQFRKHADVFRHKVGCDRLAFEHSAWQSQQCHVFAQLFEKTISSSSGNNAASQAQHPGVYYQQAASHAISRRQQSEEAIQEEPNNFENVDMNLLENADHLEYYGQRPWRPGKATLEPPDVERENAGIRALIYWEKMNVNDSQIIITLLKKSISIFEMFKSPRMTAHLTVEVAEELRKEHQYRESLELLKPVIKTYRQEKWSFLLNSVLSLSLKCSFLICAIPEYASLCLELGSLEIQHVSQEEKNRITGNLIKLLERQCPSAEPGLTSKSERAAVTEAFPLWTSNLEYNQNTETPLIDLQSISSSSFNIKVTFENQEPVTVNSPGKCRLRLVNTGTNFPVPVQGVEISINDWSIDRKFNELVFVGPCSYLDEMFELKLQQSDIDLGKFSIVSVVVTIGSKFFIKLKKSFVDEVVTDHFLIPPSSSSNADAILNIMNEPDVTKVVVRQRTPLLQMKVLEKNPILVGEWFKIKLDFFNEEDSKIEDFECKTILLDSQDPLIGDTTSVSYDPSSQLEIKSPTDENVEAYAVTKHIGELESSKSLSFNVFLKASTTGIRNVRIRIKYKIGDEFYYTLKQNLSLNAIEPFVISTEFLSVRQRNISRIYTDEPFLCIPEVRSLCSGSIRILDCRIEPRFPVEKYSEGEDDSSLKNSILFQKGLARDCFCLLVKRDNLSNHLDIQDITIGKYIMEWRRDDENDINANVTSVFELSPAKLSLGSLFIQAFHSPYGVKKSPFNLTYKLSNLTDKVQEYSLNIESSEYFLISGNKQVHFKIIPHQSRTVNYVLHPVKAGPKVPLPKLNLKSLRLAQGLDVNETLERLLPEYMIVLENTHKDGFVKGQIRDECFKKSSSIFIESKISDKSSKSRSFKS